jgi:hypothetical protein
VKPTTIGANHSSTESGSADVPPDSVADVALQKTSDSVVDDELDYDREENNTSV